MAFSSLTFLYGFLPITLLIYFLLPARFRNLWLLLASLGFYAWGEQRLVLLFAATILLGWGFGLLIERFRGGKMARVLLAVSVTADLVLLGYFKYLDFFLTTVNALFHTKLPLPGVLLPIGISFYTFQILSYSVDVYRGTIAAQRNPIDFACYVALFPQLIAGPIVRYTEVAPLLRGRTFSVSRGADGLRRFILGLAKKVLLANSLGTLCAGYRAAAPSVLYSWLYAVGFMLQIYFDFSGYSDMAIGLGKLFGFSFPENFRYPYISSSITEFWRRWHKTLGAWFRDYVYIPLGGNRKGKARQIVNILVVWALTGLWHGASWNFVLWGSYFAVLLIVEKLWLLNVLKGHPAAAHVYTILTVMFGFVLFNAADLQQAAGDLAGMFSFRSRPLCNGESLFALRSYGVTLALGILLATPLPKRLLHRPAMGRIGTVAEPLLLTMLLLLSTAYLVDGSFNPFLYFRF